MEILLKIGLLLTSDQLLELELSYRCCHHSAYMFSSVLAVKIDNNIRISEYLSKCITINGIFLLQQVLILF